MKRIESSGSYVIAAQIAQYAQVGNQEEGAKDAPREARAGIGIDRGAEGSCTFNLKDDSG